MGERAFNVSWGWEVQRRNANCDGRGTLSIGRAARLPLGGRVARKKRGSWQRDKNILTRTVLGNLKVKRNIWNLGS
ncbi:hypothetical protein TNCV_289391 [Trichonephila clavipes]|nr:hypothetical protein TNCV_289391 [Trichonephila clavipes]